jgi:two-component system, LytTR family, response regulator
LIVDDEKEAREGLFLMLKAYEQLEVVGICVNGLEAVTQITTLRPDLVFLDIQMPQVTGFEVVNSLEPPLPAFVFITAFDEYALKAFEIHALDYVVKPFSAKRLEEAVRHALLFIEKQPDDRRPIPSTIGSYSPASVSGGLVNNDSFPEQLVFKADGKIHFIALELVSWIEAYDYYVKVHADGKFYLVRETMKSMEARLPAPAFLRVHKSAIVNKRFLRSIEPLGNNDHEIILNEGTRVKASRSYANALQAWVK